MIGHPDPAQQERARARLREIEGELNAGRVSLDRPRFADETDFDIAVVGADGSLRRRACVR